MAFGERYQRAYARQRVWEDRTGRSAGQVAHLAAAIADTAAGLAARRETSAHLMPQHADELRRKARDAQEFAEKERQEARRWARRARGLLGGGAARPDRAG